MRLSLRIGGYTPDRATEKAVGIDGHRVVLANGSVCSVIQTGDVDVTALDPGRRSTVVGAFENLCRALDQPLQIVVQVRRLTGTGAPGDYVAGADPRLITIGQALRDATLAHRESALRSTPAFGRRVLIIISARDGEIGGEPAVDRAVRRVLATLHSAGLSGTVLHGDDLAHTIDEAWGAQAPGGAIGEASRPDWETHPTYARSGGVFFRGLALRRFPGIAVEPGWLLPLIHARAECDIVLHIDPVSVGEAMSSLGRRLRDLHADRLVELDREAIGDASLAAGLESLLDLRGRLARNQSGSVRLSLTAVARAHDLDELDRRTTALEQAFMTTLAQSEVTHLRHLDAAATAWPLGIDRLRMSKLVDTTAAATCVPWVDTDCMDPQGYGVGRTLRDEVPVQLDPFNATHHANANIAVFAASGHGKSYAMGVIVLEAAARGTGTVIVDPEGEYRRLVHSLGGEYLSLAPGCGASLNVFDAGDCTANNADRTAETVGAVVDLVRILCGENLNEVERALVDAAATEAIERRREDGSTPVLGDCLDSLQASAPNVAVILRRFTSGPLGELFNRPTSVNLEAPIVGIGLRDLKDELVPAATLIVAEWLWSLVRRESVRRHLVFDEVGLLCAHPPLRTLLVQLARRCRKYGTSLVVATQNVGDLLATDDGTVIATNPAIVLLGGHRGTETLRMQHAFTLTDEQRRFLERAGRGDFLLLAGARRLSLHVEAPPLYHSLLTSTAAVPPEALYSRLQPDP